MIVRHKKANMLIAYWLFSFEQRLMSSE